MTKQQRPLLAGPVAVGSPLEIKVPAPLSAQCRGQPAELAEEPGRPCVRAGHEVHTAMARGKPSSPRPDSSTRTTPGRLVGVRLQARAAPLGAAGGRRTVRRRLAPVAAPPALTPESERSRRA